ncbi:MAG: hypothetical protein H5U06_04195 [Candidatus Aminicenantes bacterium]|nr:hypothetical protein [Candidatus Aminicenantes bacterium]
MGLDMLVKRAIIKELAQRYQRGRKREKRRVLEEFIGLTGWNRSYGSWLLRNCQSLLPSFQELVPPSKIQRHAI